MIHVHLLPTLTTAEELADGVVVVIDVLRASTTITHALVSGASAVVPCLEVEDAQQTAASLAPDEAILGGERGGLPIEGFHLGNSPIDYTPRRVSGKTVVFTTTNGTRAMMLCRQARQVLIGSFVNLHAVVGRVLHEDNLHLLCAGTNGRITREDVLLAGRIADEIETLRPNVTGLFASDSTRLAVDAWRHAWNEQHRISPDKEDADRLFAILRDCQGGRNLRGLGLEGDINTAAQLNRFEAVPVLDLEAWRITLG